MQKGTDTGPTAAEKLAALTTPSARNQDSGRPKSELVSTKPDTIAKPIKGVTGRFNPKNDINSINTYKFVSQASTSKEKMLSVRASLIQNEKGVKVNGMNLPGPPTKIMDKIAKAQRFA